MDDLSRALAVAGALGAGAMGGVFFAFSSFVMRALGRLPAEHGLAAMQSINVAVINPHFLGGFLGTTAISVASVAVTGWRWGESGAIFYATGGVFYIVGTFLVTMRRNVPWNDALGKLTPADAGASAAWVEYRRRWTRWNHVRTAAALLATLSFCLGLLRQSSVG